jgi:hypothetical protein
MSRPRFTISHILIVNCFVAVGTLDAPVTSASAIVLPEAMEQGMVAANDHHV